jgi:uncharacterized protein with ATP-grasp and redox domains
MEPDCKLCFLGSLKNLFNIYQLGEEEKNIALNQVLEYFNTMGPEDTSPVAARELHRIMKQFQASQDPFMAIKKNSNDLVLSHYEEYRQLIQNAPDPFDTALRLSIAGNILDFIACPEAFDEAENYLEETIDKLLKTPFALDDSNLLEQEIKQSKTLLMLGDNAGEIVFDKLFLDHIRHPNVYYAVRGGPIINDATIKEAGYIGMNQVATVVTNGYDSPSTILEKGSKEFLDVYNQSDLVISKGQGNLEGLMDNGNSRLYFLLMVKCHVIARKLGVTKGDFVVYKNK